MAVISQLWQKDRSAKADVRPTFGELAHVVVDVVVDPKGKVAEEMLAGEKFG